ncbi:hypothetical protein IWQ57_002777 [Coemansia nantahalensis]|uniref:Uncharacterized protein n=1 Tax=Coemansia nantahalensis TaxID=2789366 RepID=A0ACC1JZ62_9FUNG|nr:hypothetical protein IWQ57_002777 [Coemansia nantahalensis]
MGNIGSRLRKDSPGAEDAGPAKRPGVWRNLSKMGKSKPVDAGSDTPKTTDTAPMLAAVDLAGASLALDGYSVAGADAASSRHAAGAVTRQSSGIVGGSTGGFHIAADVVPALGEIEDVGKLSVGPDAGS